MRTRRGRLGHVAAALLGLGLLTSIALQAEAATIYGCTCNPVQGFNHSAGQTQPVGYLISATIAGATLAPDISVSDPLSGATTKVVGVIQNDSWSGGTTDPIQLSAYISAANRNTIKAYLQQAVTTSAVTFNVTNEFWDAAYKRWYTAFAPTSPPLRAQLERNGSAYYLAVGDTPQSMGTSQNYYQMSMTVIPPPPGSSQTIRVAVSSTSSSTKVWG